MLRPLRYTLGTDIVNEAREVKRTLKDDEEVFTRHSTEVVEYLASGPTSYVCVCNPTESSIEQTATLVKGMFERDFQGRQVIVNGVDLCDEHEVEEIATFAERLLRFKAKLTIIPEQELDDPFQIVEAISKKVEF